MTYFGRYLAEIWGMLVAPPCLHACRTIWIRGVTDVVALMEGLQPQGSQLNTVWALLPSSQALHTLHLPTAASPLGTLQP